MSTPEHPGQDPQLTRREFPKLLWAKIAASLLGVLVGIKAFWSLKNNYDAISLEQTADTLNEINNFLSGINATLLEILPKLENHGSVIETKELNRHYNTAVEIEEQLERIQKKANIVLEKFTKDPSPTAEDAEKINKLSEKWLNCETAIGTTKMICERIKILIQERRDRELIRI